MTPQPATLVVPCYNEGKRLDAEAFTGLLRDDADLNLLFVNDGSTDETPQLLDMLAAEQPARIELLQLDRNRGKAEAVRRGLLTALQTETTIVGYLDADLATPPDEVSRLLNALRLRDVDVVIGARVCLLGRSIERSPVRHYLGRLFASAASVTLRRRIYDTQCGAKFFRVTPALRAAVDKPFISRWAFDVELLGRILVGGDGVPALPAERVVEEPLLAWRDVPGSKLRGAAVIGAGLDLARIAHDLARRGRRG